MKELRPLTTEMIKWVEGEINAVRCMPRPLFCFCSSLDQKWCKKKLYSVGFTNYRNIAEGSGRLVIDLHNKTYYEVGK